MCGGGGRGMGVFLLRNVARDLVYCVITIKYKIIVNDFKAIQQIKPEVNLNLLLLTGKILRDKTTNLIYKYEMEVNESHSYFNRDNESLPLFHGCWFTFMKQNKPFCSRQSH